jgi:hypothetical protein
VDESDPTMNRISEGIELTHRGERDAACRLFAGVWGDIGGEGGDPLHRCALAHSMADLQEDVKEGTPLGLASASCRRPAHRRTRRAGRCHESGGGVLSVLHVNLAECYRKLDDFDETRGHLRRGSAVVSALPDDGYGHRSSSRRPARRPSAASLTAR